MAAAPAFALADRFAHHDEPIRAAIESMTGARFVHDRLEELGWEVLIADAEKVSLSARQAPLLPQHRIHATLMTFGRPCPVTDLFGKQGRALLDRFEIPEPWRSNVTASLEPMDELDRQQMT